MSPNSLAFDLAVAVAVAVAFSCLLILPNMSKENAAGECAVDWFA